MQFKLTTSLFTINSLLAAFIGTQAVVLNKKSAESVEGAESAAVEFCTDSNLSGNCYVYGGLNNDVCLNVPSYLNDDISSVHLQSGTTCVVWVDDNCSGSSLFIGSDIQNLADYGFNDVISSFECSSA